MNYENIILFITITVMPISDTNIIATDIIFVHAEGKVT